MYLIQLYSVIYITQCINMGMTFWDFSESITQIFFIWAICYYYIVLLNIWLCEMN